jgi:acetyl-CoA acyltransferase
VELNEALAAQSLACPAEWPDLDPERVNPFGGATAIGPSLGAFGTGVLGSLVHRLVAAGSGLGLATICIGVGQGLARVAEA